MRFARTRLSLPLKVLCTDTCGYRVAQLQVVKVLQTAGLARAVAFSADGEHLAVGVHTGGIQVFVFHPQVQQMNWRAIAADGITVLSYSPSGAFLAAGSRDQCGSSGG
jgi:hypothetical protein